MWLLLAFTSALLLGLYDVAKKQALRDNAVLPVLLLNTLFSSLLFLPHESSRRPAAGDGSTRRPCAVLRAICTLTCSSC